MAFDVEGVFPGKFILRNNVSQPKRGNYKTA